MKLRVSLVVALLAIAGSLVEATAAPAGTTHGGSFATSADGTTTTGLPVTGTFTITQFKKVDGTIRALGTFTGSINGSSTDRTQAWATVTTLDGHALSGASTAAAAPRTKIFLTPTLPFFFVRSPPPPR